MCTSSSHQPFSLLLFVSVGFQLKAGKSWMFTYFFSLRCLQLVIKATASYTYFPNESWTRFQTECMVNFRCGMVLHKVNKQERTKDNSFWAARNLEGRHVWASWKNFTNTETRRERRDITKTTTQYHSTHICDSCFTRCLKQINKDRTKSPAVTSLQIMQHRKQLYIISWCNFPKVGRWKVLNVKQWHKMLLLPEMKPQGSLLLQAEEIRNMFASCWIFEYTPIHATKRQWFHW